ncbi:MAG: T9SS type A sorting domain-containing protein, partial [Chitinophagaceae bacterium]
ITPTGRIKVEAVGNIFFDINNANITVTVPAPTFDFDSPAAVSTACNGSTTATATLNVLSLAGYVTPVTLTATAGVPAGTTVSFGTSPVVPGNSSTVTLNGINTLAPGNYVVTVTGTSGVIVKTRQVTFTVSGISPVITGQPQNSTSCLGSSPVFSVTASATGINYAWQVSTDGGANYGAAPGINNAAIYTVPSIATTQNGYRYRVVITGTCSGIATSTAAILTVISPVAITAQPRDTTVCETGNVTFTVATSSTVPVIYQWQINTGAGYVNVNNGGIYAGATTPTLTLTNVTPDLNNNLYRVLVSNATCTAPLASNGALFKVNARPTVFLNSTQASVLPGQNATINAVIFPNANGFDITWYQNNNVIPGITGTSYVVDSVAIGDYKVTIINPITGCNNESNVLTIGTSASERLFIFPSPNNGQFTISYYNSAGTVTSRTVAIYDAHGAMVYNAKMPITGPYTLLNINLKGSAAGVYLISIGDANGKKITKGKVFIQ